MNGRWESFSCQTTCTQNWILYPHFLHLAALKKPKTRQFGKVKCSPHTSRLYKGAEAKRERAVGRSCLSFGLASVYSCPTRNSSKANIGQKGTWTTDEKKYLLELTQNEMVFLHKMKEQNQLKGLIKTLPFLSISAFLILILFWPFKYLICYIYMYFGLETLFHSKKFKRQGFYSNFLNSFISFQLFQL